MSTAEEVETGREPYEDFADLRAGGRDAQDGKGGPGDVTKSMPAPGDRQIVQIGGEILTADGATREAAPNGHHPVSGHANPSDEITSFMARVVPWPSPDRPGFINLHWFKPGEGGKKYFNGRPFTELPAFLGMARWGTTRPSAMTDIYFCLSRQSSVGDVGKSGKHRALRNVQNAVALKAIWFDIDAKGGPNSYATKAEAIDAFEVWREKAKIIAPSAIVGSGGGFHIYWFSDRPLSVAEWLPYAQDLKNLAILHGLKCDAGVTTDPARVLRVPGTFNWKTTPPRPCEIIGELGPDYDFDTVFAEARQTQPPAGSNRTVTSVPAKRLFDPAAFPAQPIPAEGMESLSEGINVYDDTPLAPDAVFAGCPHFFEAAKTHGAGYPQGLWMLDMLAATFMQDGRRWAHYMSNGYASYSKDDTDAMYDRKDKERKEKGLGWPSCQAFEAQGCKLCATCSQRGKIKSPLNLAGQSSDRPPAHQSFVDPYSDFAGPAFPLDVLPPTLAKFVDAECRAMGADPSAIAMAALTAVAGAIHAETRMRAGEGWWEKPILWTALVGQPSTKKSPIIEKVKKPLSAIDNERDKRWRQEYAIWQQQNQK
jgi:hypothetical protein